MGEVVTEKPEKLACEQAIKLILEYLDAELPEQDYAAMDEHLHTCRACFSRMEFEKMLKGKIKALPVQEAPDSLRLKLKKITSKF
jgi:anti-sigma factor (TIGR02949 family)